MPRAAFTVVVAARKPRRLLRTRRSHLGAILVTGAAVVALCFLSPQDHAFAQAAAEPPPPASAAPAIAQAKTLQSAGKFTEAVTLLEGQKKRLSSKATQAEKRAVAVALADAHYYWGVTLQQSYKYSEAIAQYQAAYAIDRIYRAKEAGIDLNNIGLSYDYLNQSTKALLFYQQSLPLTRKAKDIAGEATTLSNIGDVYSNLSQYNKALEFYQQALSLSRLVQDAAGEAAMQNNIGFVYWRLSQYDKALEFYQQALPLRRQAKDAAGEAATLHNIGDVYSRLSQYDKAVLFYQRALPLMRKAQDIAGEATTLSNIGTVYSRLNQYDKALEFYQQSLPLSGQAQDVIEQATTLSSLMFTFSEEQNARRIAGLAVLFGKQSIDLYQQIRRNVQKRDKATQRQYTQSVSEVYRGLANILFEQGRFSEAQEVIELLKQEELQELVGNDPTLLPEKTTLTPAETRAMGEINAAGATLSPLYDAVQALENKVNRSAGEDARLMSDRKALETQKAAFGALLASLPALFPSDAPVPASTSSERTERFTAALKHLHTDTGKKPMVVYTFVGERKLKLLLLTEDGKPVVREADITGADLAKKVERFRAALQSPKRDPRPLGKELYALLIVPIQKDIASVAPDTVLWSLDGTLRYLPLAALSPDGKTYLVERQTGPQFTRFTPATLYAGTLTRTPSARPAVAAFGTTAEADVNGLKFAALPGVIEEVGALKTLFDCPTYLDAAFTRTALTQALIQNRGTVHVASHFYFAPVGEANRSFLLLGDKTAFPLTDLQALPAGSLSGVDLLTLSACDTATVSRGDGREVEGFAALAQTKGAGAILATLWSVNDSSSAALMRRFYQARKENPAAGKTAALQLAQQEMLSGRVTGVPGDATKGFVGSFGASKMVSDAPPFTPDPAKPFAHPYYWAGFVLTGNWK